jgi:curved DNA-binding protein
MEFKNYYEILGVDRGASFDEIKKAFRKLARKYHPDVSKEKDAEQRMKEVNEAHAVLSDPEKRAAYDQLGSGYSQGQEFRAPPGWDAGFEFSGRGGDFSDFFSELFGRMGRRGEDHHAKIMLDIEDAFMGAVRQISLRVPKVDGQGRPVMETHSLNIRIPKGVREGQIIRLAGQGVRGSGGEAGDLLLEVHFRPHETLRVEGRDLHMTLPLAPWEAALGGVVSVDLPSGSLKVRIPQGAQSGRQLRVKGRGIPCDPPGDLLLDLLVVLPPADTPKARALYETMAQELVFDPRMRG